MSSWLLVVQRHEEVVVAVPLVVAARPEVELRQDSGAAPPSSRAGGGRRSRTSRSGASRGTAGPRCAEGPAARRASGRTRGTRRRWRGRRTRRRASRRYTLASRKPKVSLSAVAMTWTIASSVRLDCSWFAERDEAAQQLDLATLGLAMPGPERHRLPRSAVDRPMERVPTSGTPDGNARDTADARPAYVNRFRHTPWNRLEGNKLSHGAGPRAARTAARGPGLRRALQPGRSHPA